MHIRVLYILTGVALAGCSAPQRVLLNAGPDQQSLVRDGLPALISEKKHLVMIRPNTRLVRGGARAAFTVVVRNQGKAFETLREADISASQFINGQARQVKVLRYAELVEEEETRQTMRAVGAALVGVGRAMSAANSGYVNTTGSVTTHGPYGSSYGTYSATTYDPYRAQIAQQAAAAQTSADFAAIRAQGEANLQTLQSTILKDNTVLPGEWYGGTIVIEPPEKAQDGTRHYSISITFGGEEHTFSVSQV